MKRKTCNSQPEPPDIRIFAEEVRKVFRGVIIGREIIFLESVTSTNDTAMDIGLRRNDPEGIVVVADAQSRGRGRHGRSWVSPPGVNLYFTVLLRMPLPVKDSQHIVFMAAVAAVTAIRDFTGLKAEIRWPNDILINGRKAGGILIDMKSDSVRKDIIALGIGINVNQSLKMLPEELREGATSIKRERGSDVDRAGLFGGVLAQLESCYKIFLSGDKAVIINEWLSLDSTIGRTVTVEYVSASSGADGSISGIAEGIDDSGRLLVRLSSGGLHKVSAGDVTIEKNKDHLQKS
jgi:BirA family biotin operon repressor/biotin-[acetyl-CoA-carboxylase] ligase